MAKLSLAGEFPEVTEEDWVRQAQKVLGADSLEPLVTVTNDGIAIQPIYATPDEPFANLSGAQKPWAIMQRADIPDITAANKQILDDLMHGATGISIVLPGAVTAGAYGVPVSTVTDIKRLMKSVEMDLIAVRLDAGARSLDLAGQLLQVYQDRNLDPSRCDLTLAIDPIAGFATTGNGLEPNKIATHMTGVLRQWRESGHAGVVFAGDGRVYHESGASQAQELGFAIASVLQQMRLLEQAGADLANIWQHFGLLLSADADQFLTIAKLRAARLVWRQLQKAMGVEVSRLQLDVETSLAMMSRRDPNVNMLRTTSAAFAAGVGGADSLSVLPFSCRLGVADGFARRIARNSQIVLQEESGIGVVGDAAAGSGYVEDVTGQIAEKAWQIMQQIEAAGGMFAALRDGLVQSLIAESHVRTRQAVESGEKIIVGVNKFTTSDEKPVRTLNFQAAQMAADRHSGEMTCTPLQPRSPASESDDFEGANA